MDVDEFNPVLHVWGHEEKPRMATRVLNLIERAALMEPTRTSVLEPVLESDTWPDEISPLVAAALNTRRSASVVFGPDLCVLYASAMLGPLLGLESEDLARGAALSSVIEKSLAIDDASRAQLAMRLKAATIGEGIGNSPGNLTSVDGSRSIRVETRSIGQYCWMSTFEDITEQRETESHLLNLASHDPLTGLGNRVYFQQRLAAALAKDPDAGPAVLLVDLDRFKAVNDTLGHLAGDTLLRLIADRLQSVVRDSDVIARMGGDEFAMLMIRAPAPDQLAARAALIVDLLQRTCLVGGQVANVGASIGIAIGPGDGRTAETLMQNADLALYQAKASGRSMFVLFDSGMVDRAQARRSIELDLKKALPLRQLEVHYKTQVDIETHVLLGLQAVVRWRHPVRGLMEWSEFSSLSDQLGLTEQISDWTLRTVYRDAATWPAAIVVSVSASPSQFRNRHLVAALTRILASSPDAGSRLEIAITEGTLLQNEDTVMAILTELRSIGVKIAMDGFGTGYASLRQLASFPFDRININRALLANSSGDIRQRAIVRAIASLGASLGISTVAEGIETAAELDRIHSDGCGSLHGYLPSEGVLPGELPALFASPARQQGLGENR